MWFLALRLGFRSFRTAFGFYGLGSGVLGFVAQGFRLGV